MIGAFPNQVSQRDRWSLGIALAVLGLWNILSWQFPFFWDTVLNSKIAHWYLETGFSQLFVPENLDAGHPPFFSMYLAMMWKFFGRSLAVSHIAMLPFLILIVWQYWKLAMRFLGENSRIWALLILFCEPTFLAQSTMLSPDLALVAFYLLALNALLDKKRAWAAISMILMAMMSFRGILMVGGLFLSDIVIAYLQGIRKINLKKLGAYIPVTALTLLWLATHWQHVGWIFTPPPETYGGHREVMGIAGMARNIGLIGWRFLDSGRVFFWAWLLVRSVLAGWKIWKENASLRMMTGLFLSFTLLMMLLLTPFSNPIGHRYFMIAYLFLGLISLKIAGNLEWRPKAVVAIALLCIGLISGHFWVYPERIAQGWDSSLAHVPYFKLKKQMDQYLEETQLPSDQICADFPLLSNPYYTELLPENKHPQYPNFLESEARTCQLVLVSTLNNGYSDADWTAFATDEWVVKKEFEAGQLYLKLLERNRSPNKE